MSNGELTCRAALSAPIAFALLLLLRDACLPAVAGGGGSTTTPPVPPPPPGAAALLTADAGGVCETLLNGEAYTRSPPPLACNGGSDPYTAYLDGSGSTTTGGDP